MDETKLNETKLNETKLNILLEERIKRKREYDESTLKKNSMKKIENVEERVSYGNAQIMITNFSKSTYDNVKSSCYELHKFARWLNDKDTFPLKIRYKDNNMIFPAKLSEPNSCRFYFDLKPSTYDQLRYKFDDLLGKFGF